MLKWWGFVFFFYSQSANLASCISSELRDCTRHFKFCHSQPQLSKNSLFHWGCLWPRGQCEPHNPVQSYYIQSFLNRIIFIYTHVTSVKIRPAGWFHKTASADLNKCSFLKLDDQTKQKVTSLRCLSGIRNSMSKSCMWENISSLWGPTSVWTPESHDADEKHS